MSGALDGGVFAYKVGCGGRPGGEGSAEQALLHALGAGDPIRSSANGGAAPAPAGAAVGHGHVLVGRVRRVKLWRPGTRGPHAELGAAQVPHW